MLLNLSKARINFERFPLDKMKPKSKSSKKYGNGKGKFEKKCGSKIHKQNKSMLLDTMRGKKLSRKALSKLYRSGKLSKKARYICKECKQTVLNEISQNIATRTATDQDMLNTSSSSKNSTVDSNDKCLTTTLKDKIDKDVNSIYKQKFCSSIENVKNYKCKYWLNERPDELVNFLAEICKLNIEDEYSAFLINKCIEQIYSARHRRLVLPLAFKQNLLTYSLSNSKLLLNFNGKSTASGSYTYLKNWLSKQAGEELKVPNGIVRIVFDNEQVVGKRYVVKADCNTVPISVITSHAYLEVGTSELQNRIDLKPTNWLFKKLPEKSLLEYPSKYKNYFRESRNNFINKRITVLISEQISCNKAHTDSIDEVVNKRLEAILQKNCIECGAPNDPSYRSCRNCSGPLRAPAVNIDVPNKSTNYDPYSHFNFDVNKCNSTVQVGEPDMVNPNSFENIATIIENIGRRSGIAKYSEESNRQWLFLENDGGILFILLKLIFNVIKCQHCSEIIYGREAFEEHPCKVVHDAKYDYEYDWIVPQTGLLHFEMNSAKAFMGCNWGVFMQDICKELGFKSENSQKYIKKGSDHHKLWQVN